MDDNSRDRLTLARRFLEPVNSTHRQYEALRAFFVEGIPSAEVATRFGYTPGSFRVLVHEFRNQPERAFFVRVAGVGRPPGKQNRLREQVIPHAAMSETSSNCWKLSVIRVASPSACLVDKPSCT